MQTAGPGWNLLCFLQIPPLIIPPVSNCQGCTWLSSWFHKKNLGKPFWRCNCYWNLAGTHELTWNQWSSCQPGCQNSSRLAGWWLKTEPQAMWRTQKHQPCSDHTGPTSLYRFRNFRDQRREWKFSLSVLFPDFNQNLHIGIQRLKTFKNGRCDHLIPCFFVYHNMLYSSSKILPWWIFDICPGKKSSFELVSKYINKKTSDSW